MSHDTDENKDTMKQRFEGKFVRVFLYNGAILKGVASFDNGWITVVEEQKGHKAACNLQHVISITAVED